MSCGRICAGMLVGIVSAACGSGGGTNAGNDDASSGGATSNAGGTDGSGGAASGGATVGSGGSGGASTAGTGGAAGASIDYTAPCTTDTVTLDGTLAGGAPLHVEENAGGLAASPVSWDIVRPYGRGGMVLLRVDGVTLPPFTGLARDVDYPVLGEVILPITSMSPFAAVCAGPGSFARLGSDGSTRFALSGTELRQCPGEPVTGSLDLCLSFSTTECPEPISGSLDGVDLTGLSFYASAGNAFTAHALFTDATRRTFVMVAYQGSEVTSGYLLTQRDGPFGGATYCVGPGSTIDNSGFGARLSLVQLSRLARCDTASGGSVDGCAR